jgi:hypothetical protein
MLSFDELLSVSRPSTTVALGNVTLEMTAIPSVELDDMITRHPVEKGSSAERDGAAWSPTLRYELLARSVTNVEMTDKQAQQLLEALSIGQTNIVVDAVLRLNFRDTGAAVPLSPGDYGQTADTD